MPGISGRAGLLAPRDRLKGVPASAWA